MKVSAIKTYFEKSVLQAADLLLTTMGKLMTGSMQVQFKSMTLTDIIEKGQYILRL